MLHKRFHAIKCSPGISKSVEVAVTSEESFLTSNIPHKIHVVLKLFGRSETTTFDVSLGFQLAVLSRACHHDTQSIGWQVGAGHQ
jgi:hypothetical protein